MGWLLAASLPALVFAQNDTGEVRLSVKDNSGAAVSAAAELLNEATNTQQKVDLPDSGRYNVKNLPFGRYMLSVSKPGFSVSSQLVDISSAVPRSLEIVLSVQSVETSVEVKDSDTLLDTERTAVAYYTGSREILERRVSAPGRGLIDLAVLQPGWTLEANGILHPREFEYAARRSSKRPRVPGSRPPSARDSER